MNVTNPKNTASLQDSLPTHTWGNGNGMIVFDLLSKPGNCWKNEPLDQKSVCWWCYNFLSCTLRQQLRTFLLNELESEKVVAHHQLVLDPTHQLPETHLLFVSFSEMTKSIVYASAGMQLTFWIETVYSYPGP